MTVLSPEERMGFEPTVRAYTRLAIWSFKPLSHLSSPEGLSSELTFDSREQKNLGKTDPMPYSSFHHKELRVGDPHRKVKVHHHAKYVEYVSARVKVSRFWWVLGSLEPKEYTRRS